MNGIDTLNTVIAVVVVILVLSLIVQTLQGMVKKLFKLKSQQIESSLKDLFENALNAPNGHLPERYENFLGRFRITRWLYEKVKGDVHPSCRLDPKVAVLYAEVTKKFQQIGRVTVTGKQVFESIAKGDLLKVLDRLPVKTLIPEFATRIQSACDQIRSLDEELKKIAEGGLSAHLSEVSAIKFSAMRESLAPLLNDARSLLAGEEVNPESIASDIVNLREIKFKDILTILDEAQAAAQKDLDAAKQSGDQATIEALTAVVAGLSRVASALIGFRVEAASAIAPLRDELLKVKGEVETWYDTVMQGFEERYNRSMKTYAVILSFVVVVFFNANLFRVYEGIAGSDVLRSQIEQMGEALQKESAAPADQTLAESKQQLETLSGQYTNLGFTPLTWKQVSDWWNGWTSDQGGSTAQDRIKHDGRVLMGWIFMTLLLSIGAPFWQDALESLFGVKNLIRKKGDIKKVEEQSGEGLPKG